MQLQPSVWTLESPGLSVYNALGSTRPSQLTATYGTKISPVAGGLDRLLVLFPYLIKVLRALES